MSAIVVEDHVVHYEVLGRGRPLILLHGWVGSWRYWIPVMQAISGEYRTYALDLWGYGETEHVSDRYSISAQARLVMDFMERLGVARAAFVGHGFGGLVSLHLAARRPELAERLMLVNVPLTPDTLHPRLTSIPAKELAAWLTSPEADLDAITADAERSDPRALTAWASPDGGSEWRPSLEAIESACLVVYGKRDPAVQPPAYLPSLEEGDRHHLISLEDSGHFPMLDEPSKFNRLLADFLALPSGEPLSQLQVRSEWKRRVR